MLYYHNIINEFVKNNPDGSLIFVITKYKRNKSWLSDFKTYIQNEFIQIYKQNFNIYYVTVDNSLIKYKNITLKRNYNIKKRKCLKLFSKYDVSYKNCCTKSTRKNYEATLAKWNSKGKYSHAIRQIDNYIMLFLSRLLKVKVISLDNFFKIFDINKKFGNKSNLKIRKEIKVCPSIYRPKDFKKIKDNIHIDISSYSYNHKNQKLSYNDDTINLSLTSKKIIDIIEKN